MSPSPTTFFVVIGLPRSGTSSICQLLDNLGVYFGDKSKFVDPTKHTHNPIFYELQWVNELNDQIFKHWGCNYFPDEILPIESDFATPYVREMGRLLRAKLKDEFGDRPVVGIKDPRICFTFPLWRSVIAEMGYAIKVVFCVRDAAATIQS